MDFKNCSDVVKNITNKNEKLKSLKECPKKYVECNVAADKKRDACNKEVINDSKMCKDICESQKPCPTNNIVCGKNNITYVNECELKKADVKKDCDKECPCISKNITNNKNTNEKNYCKPSDRKNINCTISDNFVCGFLNNNSTECAIAPCSITYTNSCDACIDTNISYWTIGKCSNSTI